MPMVSWMFTIFFSQSFVLNHSKEISKQTNQSFLFTYERIWVKWYLCGHGCRKEWCGELAALCTARLSLVYTVGFADPLSMLPLSDAYHSNMLLSFLGFLFCFFSVDVLSSSTLLLAFPFTDICRSSSLASLPAWKGPNCSLRELV